MTELFKKLNFKGHNPIYVLHSPASFAAELAAISAETTVHTAAGAAQAAFGLTFAVTQAEMTLRAQELRGLTTADGIVWLAYPKQTSKAYKSDLNRDLLWKLVEPLGLEPNRQIAIDDDWSALRFRKV